MSRFDKTELESVIESMEKLLQDETAAAASGPAAEPSTNGVAEVSRSAVTENQSTSPAVVSPSSDIPAPPVDAYVLYQACVIN